MTATLAAVLVLISVMAVPAGAQDAPAENAADSLAAFLNGLSVESDEYFGTMTAAFDTTALDSLLAYRLVHPLDLDRRGGKFSALPISRFNRAEGLVLGGGMKAWLYPAGNFEVDAAYGFSNQELRYGFFWRRTLWSGEGPTADDRRYRNRQGFIPAVSQVDLEFSYRRATLAFEPSHAQSFTSRTAAFFFGRDRQSFFERRGFEARLRFRGGDWRLMAGFRDAREQSMPRAATFTLLGPDGAVPGVTPADGDDYREVFGGVSYLRRDIGLGASLEARGSGQAPWRLRGVLAKSIRVGRPLKLFTQIEGGATRADAPVQRRFQLGGPAAIPSLGFGVGDTDHSLLARLELIEGHNLFGALGIPHPDFMDFNPAVFFHYGALWDDPGGRDVIFSEPPSSAWKGAAGVALVYRPGLPEPFTLWRLQMAWPVGHDSGVARFSVSMGAEFDLLSRNDWNR